jgi:2-amino-4-hydroxy-6-hydroxymethyldihydropteridine diphosphokinase
MAQVFVGLGSNLGDRLSFLRQALTRLADMEQTSVMNCSSVYETQPVGVKEQPKFLNMVAELDSMLPPQDILRNLKDIESALGRTHIERWGPREIDLDLLYYGREMFNDENLCIPHPEIINRRFVLIPMKEIAADFLDPMQKVNIGDLLRCCQDTSVVCKIDRSICMKSKG